ncbi:MAG TPA: Os1348 family NHLP clan protein [Ktedonobacterales bacterium]|jgi:hypothetical protein
MSIEAKKRLIDRIVQDPSFRQQLKVDPEGTIQHSGLDLTEEEYTSVVAGIDLSLPDDQLQERLSKRQVLG